MAILKSSQFSPSFATPPRILVTGATGFVGSHLAERLAELGCELYLLLRQTSKLDHIAHLNFTPVVSDLRDPAPLTEVIGRVDYVFHSAGLVKAESLDEFMRVNAGGTQSLLDLALKHNPNLKRFVLISSQAAGGPSDGSVLKCENDPAVPVSDYGRSKRAAEEAVLAVSERLPVTIVRPPAVFGPRDTEVLTFFKFVRSGLMLKFGGNESFVSIVYVADLVDGILRSGMMPEGVGEIFHINTQDELSQWQAQRLMAEAMKVEVQPLRIPLWLLRRLAPRMEKLDRKLGNSPMLSVDKVKELSCRYWTTSSDKARQRLGFAPLQSLEVSLRETYDWYWKHKWV